MSTETEDKGTSAPAQAEPRGLSLSYAVYQQVASIIAAFALIAFLSHFFDIGWHGALADLVGMWDQYVRPAVRLVLDVSVVKLLKWVFGWQIEIPLTVRDYIAVGIALFLSRLKAIFWHGKTLPNAVRFVLRRRSEWGRQFVFSLLWPLDILWLVGNVATGLTQLRQKQARRLLIGDILSLSVIIYFALLLAANYLILKPGT